MDPTSIAAFGLAAVTLWMKGMIVSWAQVAFRVRSRSLVRPEDARLLKVAPASHEDPRVRRLEDVWRNELEASPATMALSAAYVVSGGAAAGFAWALAAFVVARLAQGISQNGRLQPARTIAWLAGVAASGAIAAMLLWELLG